MNQTAITFESILPHIHHVKDNANYWLIRTNGGQYYEEFVTQKFIAIGYNEITLYDVKRYTENKEDIKLYDELITKIKKHNPELKQFNSALNQVLRFVNEVKKDDIIIVPSYGSDEVHFGVVTDSIVHLDIKSDCPYNKKKLVRWTKKMHRENLDVYMQSMFHSHHAVTNINQYSSFIDRTLNSFFIKGDEAHIVLKINSEGELNPFDLSETIMGLLNAVKEISNKLGEDFSRNDLQIKLHAESPGQIEWIGKIKKGFYLAVVVVFINGGGVSKDFLYTDGLLKNINEIINDYHFRTKQDEILEQAMKQMSLKSPEDVIKLLKSVSPTQTKNPKFNEGLPNNNDNNQE